MDHGAELSIVLNATEPLHVGDDVLVDQDFMRTAQGNGHVAGHGGTEERQPSSSQPALLRPPPQESPSESSGRQLHGIGLRARF